MLATLVALGTSTLAGPEFVIALETRQEVAAPDRLLALIEHLTPKRALLQRNEMDTSGCLASAPLSSLVRADFNGDGHQDYAALVKVGLPRKDRVAWNGQTVDVLLTRLELAVFLADGTGGFRYTGLDRLETSLPADMGLTVQPPGTIHESASLEGRRVTIKHPGIERTICEKSATVWYWDTRRRAFREIWTAD